MIEIKAENNMGQEVTVPLEVYNTFMAEHICLEILYKLFTKGLLTGEVMKVVMSELIDEEESEKETEEEADQEEPEPEEDEPEEDDKWPDDDIWEEEPAEQKEDQQDEDISEAVEEEVVNEVPQLAKEEAEEDMPKKKVYHRNDYGKSTRKQPIDDGKIRALREAGWSVKEIALDFHCDVSTIYNHMKAMNLK